MEVLLILAVLIVLALVVSEVVARPKRKPLVRADGPATSVRVSQVV